MPNKPLRGSSGSTVSSRDSYGEPPLSPSRSSGAKKGFRRAHSTEIPITHIEDVAVCVIGSGPAAYTAAMYAARSALRVVVFEGYMAGGTASGGQIATTDCVENFPGFPEAVAGIDLAEKLRSQCQAAGAMLVPETVERVELNSRPYKVCSTETHCTSATVIIATGASAKRLVFKGSEVKHGYWNKGISGCSICDGPSHRFRDQPVAVVGGGDGAMEEVLYLAKYVSAVYIVHRKDHFTSSRIMQRRVLEHPKVKVIWSHEIVEADGDSDWLHSLKLKHVSSHQSQEIQVRGLFYAVGHTPATGFLEGRLETDDCGYIVTRPGTTITSVPGVFAAGDVQDRKFRQAVTACASGCMAAMDADEWIQRQAFSCETTACHYKRMLTILPLTTKCDTDCDSPPPATQSPTPRMHRRSSISSLFSKLGNRTPRAER